MNNLDLEVGNLLANLEFIITSQLPPKKSSIYPIQAVPILDPKPGVWMPSYIAGPIINRPLNPASYSVEQRLYQERNIGLYQPTLFSSPILHFQATEKSSQTTVSDSSEAHSQSSADFTQKTIIEDENSETEIEEASSSNQNKTSATGWTKEEDLRLMEKVDEIGMRWQKIAKSFPNKTSTEVKRHYQNLKQTSLQGIKKSGKWSESENKILTDLISQIGGDPTNYCSDDWGKIAIHLKSRTLQQIRDHAQRYANPNIKKFDFTSEEDRIIIQKVKQIGKQWSVIAKSLPGRTGLQIKQHYENSLDNSVRKSKWTEQEEQLLKDGVTQFGNKWAKVAEFINNSIKLDTIRTGKQCFNHWKNLSKRNNS